MFLLFPLSGNKVFFCSLPSGSKMVFFCFLLFSPCFSNWPLGGTDISWRHILFIKHVEKKFFNFTFGEKSSKFSFKNSQCLIPSPPSPLQRQPYTCRGVR